MKFLKWIKFIVGNTTVKLFPCKCDYEDRRIVIRNSPNSTMDIPVSRIKYLNDFFWKEPKTVDRIYCKKCGKEF